MNTIFKAIRLGARLRPFAALFVLVGTAYLAMSAWTIATTEPVSESVPWESVLPSLRYIAPAFIPVVLLGLWFCFRAGRQLMAVAPNFRKLVAAAPPLAKSRLLVALRLTAADMFVSQRVVGYIAGMTRAELDSWTLGNELPATGEQVLRIRKEAPGFREAIAQKHDSGPFLPIAGICTAIAIGGAIFNYVTGGYPILAFVGLMCPIAGAWFIWGRPHRMSLAERLFVVNHVMFGGDEPPEPVQVVAAVWLVARS